MNAVALIERPWADLASVAAPFADEPYALALQSGSGRGWSYLAIRPEATLTSTPPGPDPFAALAAFIGPRLAANAEGPPFQGGVAGLAGYDLGFLAEGIDLPRADWPDLACGRYLAILAFDETARRLVAVGRGRDQAEAEARAQVAAAWLEAPLSHAAPATLAADWSGESPADYEAAVAEVVARIGCGEVFQANISRRWTGRMSAGARPFDLFARLAGSSPAPFAAYFRLPGRALVSNSPERFLAIDGSGQEVRSEPIKGTRPRGATPAEDAVLGAELLASAKDRAENLMIVDLMRNDLSRVCQTGQVRTEALFHLATFANVHHLVSVVAGRLKPGLGPADLLRASFPPGSITGAPKVQAMKMIAELEPPRGPFFGSLFWAGLDGALDSSVLIRTAAFTEDEAGWSFEARAGAGIVADSDPADERRETEAKIDALRQALREATP